MLLSFSLHTDRAFPNRRCIGYEAGHAECLTKNLFPLIYVEVINPDSRPETTVGQA
jgi:hypothetical protein